MTKAELISAFNAGLSIRYVPKDTLYDLISFTKIKMESGLWVDGIAYKSTVGDIYSRALTDFKKFE
jgi:hypothetical protein